MKIVTKLNQNSNRPDRGDGFLYLMHNNFCFPEKDWFDFTFLVVSEWNGAVLKMLENNQSKCILSFLDGEHAIRLERNNNNAILTFGNYDVFEKKFVKTKAESIQLEFKVFYIELIKLNKELIKTASDSNKSEYLENMEKWFEKLPSEI